MLAHSAAAQTPAALWTFDAGTGTTATDSSGNNRTATLTGTTWTSPGKVGANAISATGGGYGQRTGAIINTSNSFTAAAWIRLNTLNSFSGILSIDGVNVSGFFLEYHSGLQRFSFARFASDNTGAAITTANATTAPVAGTWYHVAAVYNRSAQTMALYVNGVLQQSVSFTSPWRATGNTQIGRTRYGGSPVSQFNGSIDDARLYASALTASQIQALYNMGTPALYTWPTYSPTIAYDYVNEYGTFNPPTQLLNDCPQVVGSYANGWWCFRYGPNKNSLVTAAAWMPMVARFNTDFSYITDTMRWPRDLRARSGFYSSIYLYGSGLCTDDAANTDLGGWQSAVFYNGTNWPIVLASYYPVYSFDPACPFADKVFQQNAMVHEGIHCINASMPGCFNSAWFHEGGNTWLQANMEGKRSGNFGGMGFLSAGLAIAPFMPIECYSGWLQDGSFGGPSAEGVNMFNGSQQICTWKNLLGGTQYGECFPNALSHILGEKSIAWLWRNCSISGRVLQDLAQAPGGLGDAQMRRLITEFRARQAFGDFGVWSTAYKQLLNDNWGVTIDQEWSPYWIDCAAWTARSYVDSTVTGSTLTPAAYTLPGWSGANQIPLTVSGSSATVTFNPIGTNMQCVLTYQDTSGNVRYSAPVSSGTTTIPLANVKNSVIVAVICNTDYIFTGDALRSQKYNYTLTLGAGVTGKANIATQWYQ